MLIPPERVPVVAFQGEPGAFSEEALRRHFGAQALSLPCPDFAAAAREVVRGNARFAVLPVGNSAAGPVDAARQAIHEAGLVEVTRIVIPVRQMLLGLPGATVEGLREVRSHPVALAQCARFLESRPHLHPRAVADTAGAAREVAELRDPSLGALASRSAGQAWGLRVLLPDVHDDPENRTVFVVVRRPD
jgi:prephenate dehydratase